MSSSNGRGRWPRRQRLPGGPSPRRAARGHAPARFRAWARAALLSATRTWTAGRRAPGRCRSVWNRFQYFGPVLSEPTAPQPIRDGRRRVRRLRAGTRSCWTGPPVYDYRGRGAPNHCLGRIHPYARACSATGIARVRRDLRT